MGPCWGVQIGGVCALLKPVPVGGLVALLPSPSGTCLLRNSETRPLSQPDFCLDLWFRLRSFACIHVASVREAMARS